MKLSFDWDTLLPLTQSRGTGGRLRSTPEDFVVDEEPAYLPSGEGEYLYVRIEKIGHTTAHVVRELCRQLDVRDRQVGVAGLKDRHAVTRQWLSLPGRAERALGQFELDGVRILEASRHSNKLGMGHLRGNRFTVTVRGAPGTVDEARATLEELVRRGVPNYFGPQRFGLGGLNAEEGLRVMRGESDLRDPRVRRFLVSSVQSAIFNAFVSRRLELGVFDRLLEGDMAKKHDTGGVFRVDDAERESERAARGEVSATGTLFGRKVAPLSGEAGALEREVLTAFGLAPEAFSSRKGDRRFTRVYLGDPSVEPREDGYVLSFGLPKGSFATSVLREVMKTSVDVDDEEQSDADAE